MNIGIITLSASHNCGSMLQSYALREILKEYGDVEIINFSSENSHMMYDSVPKNIIKRLMLELKQKNIVYNLRADIEAYTWFQREMLGLGEKEYFEEDLMQVAAKYDIVVAGSDQIWNVCMRDFNKAFLCGWTDAKKVAYAPSLGGKDIRESGEWEQILGLIKRFDAISVRENTGKKCLDELLSADIEKVLDPTLLLNSERWMQLAGEKLINEDYIFFYSWAYRNDDAREIVRKRSRMTGLPVYVIDARKWIKHSYQNEGFKLFGGAGPLAFLNLTAYAKECYVESFHGMIFSYIFKKDFWLLDSYERYEMMDARLRELVELLDAKDRILNRFNCNEADFNRHFDYKNNPLIESMRKSSIMFLERAIKNEVCVHDNGT